jgi:hypothetical protein
MALALFRKSSPPSQPARALLREHLAEVNALQLKRTQLSERDGRARVDRDAGATSAERVAALSQSVDQAMADLRYGSVSVTDLPALREQLREAETAHAEVAGYARSAAIAHAKYSSEIATLAQQAKDMAPTTARLLHAALLEEREARRGRYQAARTEMVAALRHSLEPAFAADALAVANGWPPLGSDAAFGALEIPDLYPAEFDSNDFEQKQEHGRALEAAQRAHREDWQQTQAAGTALANALLNSTSD